MKTLSLILILLFSSFISNAQIERVPKKQDSVAAGSNSRLNKKDLVKELGLSTGQQAKLDEIRQTIRMKRKAIENNDQLTDEERKKQLRELQRSQARSIEEILTEEQKEKFRKNRKKMAEQNS
jgi:hypothetical protein